MRGCMTVQPTPFFATSACLHVTARSKSTTFVHPCCCCARSHGECAAKARKVLQDALEQYICRRDAGRGRRSSGSGNADAAVAAAKAAAKRVTAAIIAAGGDEQQLDAAAAELLDLQLGPAQLKKLLLPLLRLRQACCHPQVGCRVCCVWRESAWLLCGGH